jgi:hypothetical protein
MEDLQALVILRSLANGVDPENGQFLDPENSIQRPQTVRALGAAVRALERTERQDRRRGRVPSKAMAPWTAHDDRRLLAGFDAGQAPRDLAAEHQRSPKAIKARLVRLGRRA